MGTKDAHYPVLILCEVVTYTSNFNVIMITQIIDILHDRNNNEVTHDITISSRKRKVSTVDHLSKIMKTMATTEDKSNSTVLSTIGECDFSLIGDANLTKTNGVLNKSKVKAAIAINPNLSNSIDNIATFTSNKTTYNINPTHNYC